LCSWNSILELWGVTSQPTQVNTSLLNSAIQTGTQFIYLGGMEG